MVDLGQFSEHAFEVVLLLGVFAQRLGEGKVDVLVVGALGVGLEIVVVVVVRRGIGVQVLLAAALLFLHYLLDLRLYLLSRWPFHCLLLLLLGLLLFRRNKLLLFYLLRADL